MISESDSNQRDKSQDEGSILTNRFVLICLDKLVNKYFHQVQR